MQYVSERLDAALAYVIVNPDNKRKMLVVPGRKDGNSVVAISTDDLIRWSWHIWVSQEAFDRYNPDVWYPDNSFMDRNLGALSNKWMHTTEFSSSDPVVGCYYQWGRKDAMFIPFDAMYLAPISSMPLQISVQNPANVGWIWDGSNGDYSWSSNGSGNYKTVYDPCPEGWVVPRHNNGTWEYYNNTNFTWSDAPNAGRTNADGVFFPAAGYQAPSLPVWNGWEYFGHYWSASTSGAFALSLNFSPTAIPIDEYHAEATPDNSFRKGRSLGFHVRCVKAVDPNVPM
jgi:hypothetical protein